MIGATETSHQRSVDSIILDQQLGWIHGFPLYNVKDLSLATELPDNEHATPTHMLTNTSVLAAKSEILWNVGWNHLPQMMELFDDLQNAIGTSYERAVLEKIFQHPKLWDISLTALLQLTPNLAVIELKKVLWSDWAKPQQILENLAEIGKQPVFPVEYARSAGAWL